MKDLDKYKGCLIGGAIGDALGYSVKLFYDPSLSQHQEKVITEYKLTSGVAQISDATQMMLFTANGLLIGTTRAMIRGNFGSYTSCIYGCYKEWLRTQDESYPLEGTHSSWLVNVEELFSDRDADRTSISALRSEKEGTIDNPINDSKASGAIARVVPIGLYLGDRSIKQQDVNRGGAEITALTHGHQLAYIPAAALVHLINLVSHNKDISLSDAVYNMKNVISEQFSDAPCLPEIMTLIDKAIKLSSKDIDDQDAIKQLGKGWTAEIALAIAIYCVLKYQNDFEKCIITAVNHSGNGTVIGAVAGSILGSYLGYNAIPKKFIDKLELKDVITEIANDLFNDCRYSVDETYRDDVWKQKYIEGTYKPTKDRRILIFPKFQELKEEVKSLRNDLSKWVFKHDELRFVICKNLEMKYMLELGKLEYQVYDAKCKALRLKRKIDIIQMKINRQEKIVISEIEKKLDEEFTEYKQKLDDLLAKMNESIERLESGTLTEEESTELKALYRSIVKKLHPDVNPDGTKEELDLFKHAVTAYENGNLMMLRIIDEMIGEKKLPDESVDAMAHLVTEKERLIKMIDNVKKKITEIKSKFPYTVKELLKDSEAMEEKKMELEDSLKYYKERIEVYTKRINEMLR